MNTSDQAREFLKSHAVLDVTRRAQEIDRFEAHFRCTQYNHLDRDWWGFPADFTETVSPGVLLQGQGFDAVAEDESTLGVRKKRPTAPYNLCRAIVNRFTGLLFSEARRPDILVEEDPQTQDYLRAAAKQMRLWPKLREARNIGGACGSVMLTVHLKNSKFTLETHKPQHVQVVWKDRQSFLIEAALIAYTYDVELPTYDEKTGEMSGTRIVQYLYRRIITETEDTVYTPIEVGPDAYHQWDIESSVKHDLGFFPGVWVQNLPEDHAEDGEPDCAGAWQTFDTIDRLLSQMNKGVLSNMDPTLSLAVDPKVVAAQGGSVRKGSQNALYLGPGGSASYLEINGAGINMGGALVDRLKQNALDVCRCVLVDPQTVSGAAQSAKAIEYIYAPMLEKADDLRSQYGDLCIVPLMEVVLQMAKRYDRVTQDGRNVLRIPPRVEDGKVFPRELGKITDVTIKWGPYFAPTDTDRATQVSTIVSAKTGGIIDLQTAVDEAAVVFEVADAEAMLQRVTEEEKERVDSLLGGSGGFGAPSTYYPQMDKTARSEADAEMGNDDAATEESRWKLAGS